MIIKFKVGLDQLFLDKQHYIIGSNTNMDTPTKYKDKRLCYPIWVQPTDSKVIFTLVINQHHDNILMCNVIPNEKKMTPNWV